MKKRTRRGADEKARIALEALKEDKPLAEIAAKYGVHPNQITQWKKQLMEKASDAFLKNHGSREKELESEREDLYKHIGKLEIEKEFLKKKLHQLGLL